MVSWAQQNTGLRVGQSIPNSSIPMQKHFLYLVINYERLRIWGKRIHFQEMSPKWTHEIYPVFRITKKNTTMPDKTVTHKVNYYLM